MALDAGSNLQATLQQAVQPKLIENGWVVEENDTTLCEYVTMMIVNGKDLQGVQSELGGELLGIGEDDPAVQEFARWLFDTVQSLQAPQQQETQAQEQEPQPIPTVQDAAMEDTPASADAPPTGPKSMRNGPQRGRGGRMLGQMNRSMDRSTDLPDNLRRIKGAAGGQSGRINSHSARDGPPRGPRGLSNGMQRMMNGGAGRGGHQNNMNMMGMMGGANNQQQMQFMQMMEMQANLLQQMVQQNGGQLPNMNGRGAFSNGRGGRGNARGGRGGQHNASTEPKLKAVDGKMPDGPLPSGPGGVSDGMDVDEKGGDKFATACRFDLHCTNPSCGFAHHGPMTRGTEPMDMTITCTYGAACKNPKCVGRHPSPSEKAQHLKEVDCKFFPNCTSHSCPFRHPTTPLCNNGADCSVPNCKFTHSKIMCRYNPCLNPQCTYKHGDGQKRGNFQDKVWTAPSEGKSERFAELNQDENGEELILPGQQQGENGAENGENSQMETQVIT